MSGLNEKIALWCGFTVGYWALNNRKLWTEPNEEPPMSVSLVNQHDYDLPKFTESMDAILKWVMPKLTDYAIEWHGKDMHRVSIQTVLDDDLFYRCDNKSIPMAFCLALEKYIDAEEK